MTHRERILAAICGEVPDQLPWVPRLEFWHRARSRQGTLPAELKSLTLPEVAKRLGVGCYDSIPDFTNIVGPIDMIDRTLGVYNLPHLPYRVILEDGSVRHLYRESGDGGPWFIDRAASLL